MTDTVRFLMRTVVNAGEILEAVMIKHGWTQNELANAMGSSTQTIHRWLHGKANVDERRLARGLIAAGEDPLEHGLRIPTGTAGMASMDEPPQWFVDAHAELHAKLDKIIAYQERENL